MHPTLYLIFSFRLRHSYPSYINTPTLLIDIVSVMGNLLPDHPYTF
jgi:hypothetical protein